jgi:hypothetical protein
MPSREPALVAADHRRREGRVKVDGQASKRRGEQIQKRWDSGSAALYGHFGFSPVGHQAGLLTGE